jgi:amino acid transporter
MDLDPQPRGAAGLTRALGTFDLVLLYVAAIVGLRWLSTAAQLGPASLTLWALACLAFFVPCGLAIQELSSRIPHEGGLFLWTRAAFGETHGFLAGWAYWLQNLVFFPSLLLYVSGVVLHIAGGSLLWLADNSLYNGMFCLTLLWAVTLLNIVGLQRAKWLQNIGGIATMALALLVLAGGALAWWRFGSASSFSAASLVPRWTSPLTLNTFALLLLAYTGLELAPVLGDEIKDSSRSIRRAMLMAGALIAIIYIAGTAALLVSLPGSQISAISGIPQAMEAIGQRSGIASFGVIAAVLLTLTATGGLGAWVTGTARLPFVLGLGNYLPERLGAVHPRYGSPHVALLVQAGAVSLVLMAAISGSTIREAFQLLNDMTAALNCAVWVYIFASLLVLRRRAAGNDAAVALIPGGLAGCAVVAVLGASVSAFATVVAMIPPAASASPGLFLVKGIGGCALIFAVGMALCRQAQRRQRQARALASVRA